DDEAARFLDGLAVREGVPDGGVAGDALAELDARFHGAPLEEPLDALVDEPQAGLHVQNRLADDGEPEVAGFDEPRMDRSDGDLVDAGAVDGQERVRLGFVAEGRCDSGVGPHGVPALRPVLVQDEASGPRMADGHDTEEVVYLPLEAA